MTDEEFDHAAKDLKMVVDPRMFVIAERDGQPVGFSGILPDLNEALVGLDGRLFPFGLFRLLWRKRKIRRVRVVILGVAPRARGKGVDAAFFVSAFRKAAECGYEGGEASWVLEDNARMRADIEATGARVTKRYRLYETPGATAPMSASTEAGQISTRSERSE
jgi:GNAT superfamily N-acetyltransferase